MVPTNRQIEEGLNGRNLLWIGDVIQQRDEREGCCEMKGKIYNDISLCRNMRQAPKDCTSFSDF